MNPSIPSHYRVFSACAIGVMEGEIDMVLVLPGTPRPKLQPEPESEQIPEAVQEPTDDNAAALKMLEEIHATHTQGNGRTDESVR